MGALKTAGWLEQGRTAVHRIAWYVYFDVFHLKQIDPFSPHPG